METLPRAGSLQSTTTLTTRDTRTKKAKSQIISKSRKLFDPPGPEEEPLASVGLSLACGMNTEFGKEKIEVVAWCTLPCRVEDVPDTYNLCYSHVAREVKEKLDLAVKEFFPDLAGDEK